MPSIRGSRSRETSQSPPARSGRSGPEGALLESREGACWRSAAAPLPGQCGCSPSARSSRSTPFNWSTFSIRHIRLMFHARLILRIGHRLRQRYVWMGTNVLKRPIAVRARSGGAAVVDGQCVSCAMASRIKGRPSLQGAPRPLCVLLKLGAFNERRAEESWEHAALPGALSQGRPAPPRRRDRARRRSCKRYGRGVPLVQAATPSGHG